MALLQFLLFMLMLVLLPNYVHLEEFLRKDCGSRHHIENGYVDFSNADTTLSAPVVCRPGHSPISTGKIICQEDGTWKTESCVPKDCKRSVTVKHGEVTFYEATTFGEIAKVTCDEGYTLHGHPYLMCQADGTWSTNTTCQKADCGDYITIPNGYVEFKGGDTTWKSKYNVSCDKGYEVHGEKIITCQADGTWTNHTLCNPLDCGTWYYIQNGYADFTDVETTYNEKLPVYCNAGYSRQGNDYLICDGTGAWSWPEGISCNPVECGTDHVIANGNANFTSEKSIAYGEIVPVYCDPGFELVGEPYAICDANGQWSGTKCEAQDCGTYYVIEHGTINYETGMTTYQSRASVKCDKGYKIQGEEEITCLSSGTWSMKTKCVPQNCGTVYHLENGYVDFAEVEVIYKKRVKIICNDGYIAAGYDYIECLHDGRWSEAECRNEQESYLDLQIITGLAAGAVLAFTLIIFLMIVKYKQKRHNKGKL